jgi:sugar/nucleoside kinase (ribokinase family)
MKRYDVAVVGEIYEDHVFTGFQTWPKPGEEVFTSQYIREVGGGGAITACSLAKLGRKVCLVGTVGAEDRPWLDRRLSSFGVLIDGLVSGSGRSGVTVSLSVIEDRSFFTYIGENSRLEEQLARNHVVEMLLASRHVHFAMPITAPVAQQLIPRLHAAGCKISLDVGHHAEWLRDPANHITRAKVDYFLPNQREAEFLSGSTDVASYLGLTRQLGWRTAVVKLGRHGAAMRQGAHTWTAQSPDVQVIDTTGAGDAFDAGFIDALLDRLSAEECLRRACVCGSMSTRAAGALTGLPSKKELQEFYEQSYTA